MLEVSAGRARGARDLWRDEMAFVVIWVSLMPVVHHTGGTPITLV